MINVIPANIYSVCNQHLIHDQNGAFQCPGGICPRGYMCTGGRCLGGGECPGVYVLGDMCTGGRCLRGGRECPGVNVQQGGWGGGVMVLSCHQINNNRLEYIIFD